jgi:hypothetical protein
MGYHQGLLRDPTVIGEFPLRYFYCQDLIKGTDAQKAERLRIKNIIVSDNFSPLLEKSIAILKPIDELIVKYQSDQVTISEVLPDFHALPAQFARLQCAAVQEINFLQNASKDRLQFMYGKAHGHLYLLDPRFLGEGLPPGNRVELETSCSNVRSMI